MLVFPYRNCLFKDVFSTSSYMLVSLMAQWISMCTMSVNGLGFKSHRKAALVFPCRNCLFIDLTHHRKDVFSKSSCVLVSLMAQWISMCTMSVKRLGFKSHGRLRWSFLAEKAFLMTSRSSCYLVLPHVTK